MSTMLRDEIVRSVSNIEASSLNAQISVMESMVDVYSKAYTVLENYEGQDVSGFQMFQEGFFQEDGEETPEITKTIDGKEYSNKSGFRRLNENGEKESVLWSIAAAIPRLIGQLVKAIMNFFSNNKINRAAEAASEPITDNDTNDAKSWLNVALTWAAENKELVAGVGGVLAGGAIGAVTAVVTSKKEAQSALDKLTQSKIIKKYNKLYEKLQALTVDNPDNSEGNSESANTFNKLWASMVTTNGVTVVLPYNLENIKTFMDEFIQIINIYNREDVPGDQADAHYQKIISMIDILCNNAIDKNELFKKTKYTISNKEDATTEESQSYNKLRTEISTARQQYEKSVNAANNTTKNTEEKMSDLRKKCDQDLSELINFYMTLIQLMSSCESYVENICYLKKQAADNGSKFSEFFKSLGAIPAKIKAFFNKEDPAAEQPAPTDDSTSETPTETPVSEEPTDETGTPEPETSETGTPEETPTGISRGQHYSAQDLLNYLNPKNHSVGNDGMLHDRTGQAEGKPTLNTKDDFGKQFIARWNPETRDYVVEYDVEDTSNWDWSF